MKPLRQFILGITLFLSMSAGPPSWGSNVSTIDPPLEKCGEARLSLLFWDIYESTLYTPDGRYEPDVRPLRLEIRYLRSIRSEDLVAQTRKEWAAQGLASKQHDLWLETLGQLWRDVAKGDVIALTLSPSGSSTFHFNDQPLGRIPDPEFGRQFAGIWLSPNTTRPELRAALIGKTDQGAAGN